MNTGSAEAEKQRMLYSKMRTCRLTSARQLYVIAFLISLLFIVCFGCEKSPPPRKAAHDTAPAPIIPAGINLNETRLAVIAEDYDTWGNISFRADGGQVFYQARKKEKTFIVVSSTGGETIGPSYRAVSFLAASSDNRRFAFGGVKGKKYLVVDNEELKFPSHEEIAPTAFSPDGRFLACEVGGLTEKQWFIVVFDGKKEFYRSEVYPHTFRQPAFSPDSRFLVYELGEKNEERILFFLDLSTGKIINQRRYADFETGKVYFSSNNSRAIYALQKEGKQFLVMYDIALDQERKIELPPAAGPFLLSPNGKYILYGAAREGQQFLIVSPWESPSQKKESGLYEGIGRAFFTPGTDPEAKIVFFGNKKNKWRMVAGDKESAKYDGIGDSPVFSPDGARMAYPAMKDSGEGQQHRRVIPDGKWVMVVSHVGSPAKVTEGPLYDMVVTPVFSPDGRRIAYRARTGPMEKAKRFIVIADSRTGKVIKEGRVGDEIWPPVWSADGKAVAYGARQGRELWWRVEIVQ